MAKKKVISTEDCILKGMQEILWGSAWADHVEAVQCQSLSGCDITEVMPKIPKQVAGMCQRIAGHIEQANGSCLIMLLYKAAQVDGKFPENHSEDPNFNGWDYIDSDYAERFGNCLMYGSQGAGVSWFDDHEQFDLKIPYGRVEMYELDLKIHAEQHCEECKASTRTCQLCSNKAPGKSKYCLNHSQER